MGFEDEKKEFYLLINGNPRTESEQTIQERIDTIQSKVEKLCDILEVNKEIEVQDLGRQTLEEQQDTQGKREVLDDVTRQIQELLVASKGNNHELK